jgi:hypothetical protein
MRRHVLAVIVAATVSLVGAKVALAAVASTISIGYNAQTENFHGKVHSPNAECQAGRTVRLYKRTANGPSLQGRGRSGPHGAWKIQVMHPSGHYYAVVPKAKVMNIECGRAASHTITQM